MARNTAYRTVNVKGLGPTKMVATWDQGMYIDLHWFSDQGPVLDVVNVYDYKAGRIQDNVNVSAELTEWLKEHDSAELANYYRHTV